MSTIVIAAYLHTWRIRSRVPFLPRFAASVQYNCFFSYSYTNKVMIYYGHSNECSIFVSAHADQTPSAIIILKRLSAQELERHCCYRKLQDLQKL